MRTRADVKRDIIMVKQELESLYKEYMNAKRCNNCENTYKPGQGFNSPFEYETTAPSGIFSYKACPYCDFEVVVKF